MSANNLLTCINPCTGQAVVSLPLLSRPGRGGLDLSLGAAYGSGTLWTATHWNQEAPTGVLGLGWTLGRDRILASYAQSAASGDAAYALAMNGSVFALVCIGTNADGTSAWATTQYSFWKITYDPGRETWTVIDENGMVHLFGDDASGRGTVDWGVAWGDWIGPSGSVASQQSLALGWSLNSVSDRFGNRVIYAYDQVPVQVAPSQGGLAFTQASYLKTLIGVDGSTITLEYQEKTSDEYQDPHTDPSPPNGWQNCYETRYLESAGLTCPSGECLAEVVFGYGPDTLGSGSLTKRLLTSVTRYSSTGSLAEPPALLSYWGQGGGDGVSASAVQSGNALYGALKEIVSPLGGTLSYAYKSVPLDYASRALSLDPPAGASGWTDPVIYAGDEYVLATWLDGTTAHVLSYSWSGRWIPYTVMDVPLGSTAYGDLQLAASPFVCAALCGGEIYAAAPDATAPGAWFPAAHFTLSPALGAGEAATLAVGRDFAAVLGTASGGLYTFRFTGIGIGTTAAAAGWVADTVISLGGTGAGFAMSAQGSLLGSLAVTDGNATFSLAQLLPSGAWSQTQQDFALGGLSASGLGLELGLGFAVAWNTAAAAGGFQTNYASIWWSGDANILSAEDWPDAWSSTEDATARPIICGSTVAAGQRLYRFTGAGWNACSANANTYGATVAAELSVGSDLVARSFTTSAGNTVDLLAYDPLAGTWSVPAGMQSSSADPLAAVAPTTAFAVANYAVIGTSLRFRDADGDWSSVLDLPVDLTADDLATIRVMGGNYLVFQRGTGTTLVGTCVYLLQNGGVANSDSPLTLPGQQITVPSGQAGVLVSGTGFATYSGTYGSDTSQPTLYRPVCGGITGAQTGYVVAYAQSDSGYTGQAAANPILSMAFDYSKGTVDPSGTVPLFNTVTAAPGQTSPASPAQGTQATAYYNGLTAAETPATAYPAGTGNASTHTRALIGAWYQSWATATGTGNSQVTISQSIQYLQVTLLALGSAGVGAYARCLRTSGTLDGVASSEDWTYDTGNGLPATQSVSITNEAGTQDVFSQQFTYFYSEYAEAGAALNLLSPVVQTVSQSQPAGATSPSVIGKTVTTWRDWGQDRWAPDAAYQALNKDAVFTAWEYGQTPPDSDFVLSGEFLALTPQGLWLESANAQGTNASVTYDLSLTYPITSAGNCASAQSIWYGCEPYESTGPWVTTVPGQTLTDSLTTDDYHTGTCSLALAEDTPGAGPLLQVQPADQTRRYLFSCWANAAQGYSTADGIAAWTLTLYDPATSAAVGTPFTLDLTPATDGQPTAVGQWTYFQITLDLPALAAAHGGPLGIRIQAANANTDLPCYVDELRFMPLDCAFAATVYDPVSFRPTASIDSAGQCAQVYYDDRDRPYVSVGPNGQVSGLQVPTYSRWIGEDGTFQPAFPNVVLGTGSAVAGQYLTFRNADPDDWIFSDDLLWKFAGGALTYTGTATGTAACQRLKAPNQAVRVSVALADTAGASAALGNATYCMRWTNPTTANAGMWTLEKIIDGQPVCLANNAAADFDPDWLFTVIDGMVVAYAGSVQLFAYLDSEVSTADGAVTLEADAGCSFSAMTLLQDPYFNLSANDGMGRPFSSVALLGYQPTGQDVLFSSSWVLSSVGTYYDSLGRSYVEGEALEARLAIDPPDDASDGLGDADPAYELIPQDQDTYLYSPAGIQLELTQYLGGAGGRTFTQTAYEASPLGRPTDIDAPRGPFVTGTRYCTLHMVYGSSNLVGDAPATGDGLYAVTACRALLQSTDAPSSAAPAVTLMEQVTTDSAGRVLRRQNGPAAGPFLSTGYAYDDAGLLASINYPNFYAPPAGTEASDWQETREYDFLGRLVSQTTPDSGETQWAYDSLGQVRFLYNANGVPANPGDPPTILYRKYDKLGRTVEAGYIRDSRYTWGSEALDGKLDDPAFPVIALTPVDGDDATGAVSQAFQYDTDGSFSSGASYARYLVGRLAQATVTPGDGATAGDVEVYAYDAAGNVLTKIVQMPGLSPAAGWTIAYTYDAANQIASLTYPRMDATAANPSPAGSATQAGYGYDRLGRMAAVGGQATYAVVDPDNPPQGADKSYAAYTYDTYGNLACASYNNAGGTTGAALPRAFGYDSNQRLTSITDPYFSQAVTYDSEATMTGWTYFQSKIDASASRYIGSGNATQPLPDFTQTFAYDGYGRLLSAENTLGSAFSLDLGASEGDDAYDANGNILGLRQGAGGNAYAYDPPEGDDPSNRVLSIQSASSAEADFSQSADAWNGWSCQSNNGLPATSIPVGSPLGDGQDVLMLAGGSADHYETLALATFLTPGLTYTLAWNAATDAAYPAAPGEAFNGACWYAILYGPSGPVAAVPLKTIAKSSTAWIEDNYPLDLTAEGIADWAGIFTEVVWVGLELRNLCTGARGTPGPAVYLKTTGVTSDDEDIEAATFAYDAVGNLTAAPHRNLPELTYDVCTGLTSSIAIGETEAAAAILDLAYGADGLRSRATLTPPSGSEDSATRTITVTGAYGELLGTQTLCIGTTSTTLTGTTYYINGIQGALAMVSGAQVSYLLTDRLGSLRGVVQEPSGGLLASGDTQSFGGAQRTWGAPGTDIDFTGQRRDASTGLYNYNARLYDQALGRFPSVDPAGQGASPYAYCGNDPVNNVDPSGEIWALIGGVAATGFGSGGLANFYANRNDTDGIVKGMEYFAVGGAAGAVWAATTAYTAVTCLAAGTAWVPGAFLRGASVAFYLDPILAGFNTAIREQGFQNFTSAMENRSTSTLFSDAATQFVIGLAASQIGRFIMPQAPGNYGRADRYELSRLTRAIWEESGKYKMSNDLTQGLRSPWLRDFGFFWTRPADGQVLRVGQIEHGVCQRFFKGQKYLVNIFNSALNFVWVPGWFNTNFLEVHHAENQPGALLGLRRNQILALRRGLWIFSIIGFTVSPWIKYLRENGLLNRESFREEL